MCLEVPKGTWEFQKEVVIGVVDTSAAGSRLLLPLLRFPSFLFLCFDLCRCFLCLFFHSADKSFFPQLP